MKQTRFLFMALVLGLMGCSSGDNEEITASGTLEATEVTVSAEVIGRVVELRYEEGSRIAAGDTLAVLDNTDYVLQLRQAEAALSAAEAQYRLALEGFRKEDILQAEANFQTAEADYNRMKELLASQSVTQKQYDDAYARYVTAKQTYEKLTRGLRQEEIRAAQAHRDQVKAQVELIKNKIGDCFITAPIAGTATHRFVEAGEFVNVGSSVARIANLDQMDLWIYVPEPEVGKIQLQQLVDVQIDSFPDKTFAGRVVFISPEAEFTPKNIQTKDERVKLVFGVKIKVENPNHELKSGLPADATIRLVERTTSE